MTNKSVCSSQSSLEQLTVSSTMPASNTKTHICRPRATINILHPSLQHVWARHGTHTWSSSRKARTCIAIRQSGGNLIKVSHMCREKRCSCMAQEQRHIIAVWHESNETHKRSAWNLARRSLSGKGWVLRGRQVPGFIRSSPTHV